MSDYRRVTIKTTNKFAQEVYDALMVAAGNDTQDFEGELELSRQEAELFANPIFETECVCPTCEEYGTIAEFRCPTCECGDVQVSTLDAYDAPTEEEALYELYEEEEDRRVWGDA